MRNVIEIHMEPKDSSQLQHIAQLRWRETSKAGERGGGAVNISTRAQMYDFVKNNKDQAYAISKNDDTYAFLKEVDNGNVQYVKTMPDSTKGDNLLSLPRF